MVARCLHHPFIRGIADGTLPTSKYNLYVAQDVVFLSSYISALVIGLKSIPSSDKPLQAFYAKYLYASVEELKMRQLEAEARRIRSGAFFPLRSTVDFSNYIIRVAQTGELDALLGALAPCARLYAYIGQEISRHRTLTNPYASWIDRYGDIEMERIACKMERILDQSIRDTRKVREHYCVALEYEYKFFEACYRKPNR